jgi:hypothetical protein
MLAPLAHYERQPRAPTDLVIEGPSPRDKLPGLGVFDHRPPVRGGLRLVLHASEEHHGAKLYSSCRGRSRTGILGCATTFAQRPKLLNGERALTHRSLYFPPSAPDNDDCCC